MKKFLAWCVHFYTALGLVAAGGMAVYIYHGTPGDFRMAFVLMLVATIIDATDGTLARMIKVKEVLPRFDGRRLDDLIDFQTYTSLPLLLIWRAELVHGHDYWLLLPLLASAYGFCQVAAKTDDGYFLGFPSYWNIVAFYLYVLRPPTGVTIGLLTTFAVLTFVPARYLYPTHRGRLNRWANLLAVPWCLVLVAVIAWLPEGPLAGDSSDGLVRVLALLSLIYPAMYLGTSWFISLRILMRARSQNPSAAATAAAENLGFETAPESDLKVVPHG